RTEDKPILLSIGYSACHWCHVMEHESFENEAIAAVMNRHFVCIKVDREERPDLDRIYQSAHQLLLRRPGGWPLTMFLTPDDHVPFFGGTYFPATARHGLPAFPDLLQRVAGYYREHRGALGEQNASVREALSRADQDTPSATLSDEPLRLARQMLEQQFDPVYGGFGAAPKFPHPTHIDRCLRAGFDGAADDVARRMAHDTLSAMARGGLFDQIGGGFFRYSVDERWEIPHFEKMLYDNGPLLELYAEAAVASGDRFLRQVAYAVGTWVLAEMQGPDGGYFATLDADSEGHEGRFYVFDPDEVRRLLPPPAYEVLAPHFGLDLPPNFEGRWHLRVARTASEVAEAIGRPVAAVEETLALARAKLAEARAQRVRPGRDEKVLTSWNGLMIKGMAEAGRLLDKPDFVASAERAFDFIRTNLWTGERLLAVTRDGRARLNAYLDDYAFLLAGGLALLSARWRDGDLSFLVALADALIEHFEDESSGGFFFTSDDHEQLLYRPKPGADEATPAGNAVAALALLRLGHLLGRTDYLACAERTVEAFFPAAQRYAAAYGSLLNALDELLHPTEIVILRGPDAALTTLLQRPQGYHPRRLILALPNSAADRPGTLAHLPVAASPLAYICRGHECAPPVSDPAELDRLLNPA
ncbi:MAG: thioredoxin domain-containing protein, partial [Acidiferrobacteraceae bacterium]